ncbi:MAG: hypothetical protein V2A77_00140 [Pseudomonadota bacterium]
MKKHLQLFGLILCAICLLGRPAVAAEETGIQLPPGLSGIKIDFQGYVDYSAGHFQNIAGIKPGNLATAARFTDNIKGEDWKGRNFFELTRGYINITKDILPWLSARVTPDVTRVASTNSAGDPEAEAGDIDLRIKYYYLQIQVPDFGPFTFNAVKIGQQQFPYLDFLEQINPYRMQGTMFQERFNEFDSADMGLGIQGLFGGKVSEEYQAEVNRQYPGRHGSYQVALVNGGGYHASEKNNNKPLEYRLTARPLPDVLPGLQVTWFGIWGKGNTAAAPDWRVNTGLLSYQHKLGTVTFEFARNKGQQDGADEFWRTGYAAFAMFRPPMLPRLRLSGQYGVWRYNTGIRNNDLTLWRGGLDWSLTKPKDVGGTFIYAGYEQLCYGSHYDTVADTRVPDEWRGQIVAQINW